MRPHAAQAFSRSPLATPHSRRIGRAAAGALLRREYAELRQRIARTSVRARLGEALLTVTVVALVLATGWASKSPAALSVQGAATALLVPLRRILPALTVLVAGVLLGFAQMTFALPVLVYGAVRCVSAAGRRSRLRSPLALVSAAVLLTLAITLPQLPARAFTATPYTLAYPAGMALLFLVAPAMPGIVVGQRRLLVRTLRERNQYLERAQRLAETRSRLRERARIAQEMHDLLGHRLTLISLYAGGLELTTARSAPGLSEEVGIIAGTARTAMGELREVLGVLRQEPESRPGPAGPTDAARPPGTGGQDGEGGFEEDVRDLVEGSRHAGLPVELSWKRTGDADPAPVVRRAVHRVVRESLTNVHKHAPAAAEVRVVVETGPEEVRIAVRNSAEGGGHHPARLPGSGSGLVGLEERVRLLGGTLRHGRDESGGFAVEAELPTMAPGAREFTGGAAGGPAGAASADGTADGCSVVPLPGNGGENLPSRRAQELPAVTVPGRLRGGLGCTVTLMVVLAGITGIGLWILSETREANANGDRYGQVRTGMTRTEVERITGAFAEGGEADELRAREPSRPRGADCAYALGIGDGSPLAYRYCFAADRLVQKKRYPVSSDNSR